MLQYRNKKSGSERIAKVFRIQCNDSKIHFVIDFQEPLDIK